MCHFPRPSEAFGFCLTIYTKNLELWGKKKNEMGLFCQLSILAAACNLFCSTLLLQPDWFLKSSLQNFLAFQNSFLVLIFNRTLLFTHLSFLWISEALCLLLRNSWCGVFLPCFPILLSGLFFFNNFWVPFKILCFYRNIIATLSS